MKIEELLKKTLSFKTVSSTNYRGGGCISEGQTFCVDDGRKIFVKQNSESIAKVMFDGEYESLKAIEATATVRVPHPIAVIEHPSHGAMLVMEHLDLKHCSNQGDLGTQLAKLHLHNIEKAAEGDPSYVSRFGFHVRTSCGSIPQSNKWSENWIDFYVAKLEEQIRLQDHDSDLHKLWPKLKAKIPHFFDGLDIKPSLLHGDLWSGNAGQVGQAPAIFDAASFYGHHEYDLGIAGMFGGFSSAFYSSYHQLIPKAAGFEQRHLLYKLFHNLNHWNHFGSGYKSGTISIMKKLI